MTVRRPWTEQLVDLVNAHPGGIDVEEVIAKVTPWVPQGHAYRARAKRMEHQARRWRRAHGLPEDLPRAQVRADPHPAEVHRIGARVVLTDVITGAVRFGRIVRIGNKLFPGSQADATRCTPEPERNTYEEEWPWMVP